MRASRRRFHVAAVAELVLGIPTVLSSLLVVALLGHQVAPGSPWLFPVLWLVSGAIVFVPVTDRVLAALAHRLRKPTNAEGAVLQPLLESVCDNAGVDPRRYWLRIQNSREINAMAVGGHVVGVSTAALGLPPAQLEAVLAHELGHHLAGHTKISLLRWWYEMPARLAVWLVLLVAAGVYAVRRAFRRNTAVAVASGIVLVGLAILAVVASPWLLLVPVIAPLVALTSRRAELHADRVAAELGYGPLLLEVLQRWIREGHDDMRARAGFRARMLASHPSCAQRISRLQQRR